MVLTLRIFLVSVSIFVGSLPCLFSVSIVRLFVPWLLNRLHSAIALISGANHRACACTSWRNTVSTDDK